MSDHLADFPSSGTASPTVEILDSVPAPTTVPSDFTVMTVVITLPPGSPGTPPHRHPGPAFGYVIKGELAFELEGEPERIIRAGESFWEPGGDKIHYRGANNLPDAETQFVATLLAAPGQPVLTLVTPEELEERKHLRTPRPAID